ncbi:hypothetical protein B7H23_04355 [Notoacmeibacter marinus]|uniref:Uncharacterized protein n=1 Tax=Notoacmeibacter marinus TaxID=1876515 RepID=A0A231V1T8_9HYPH|nr:hypothetical protein B7H23_04355 [Notoacmeibacter marinus]
MLDDETEYSVETWVSPLELARSLLMRRIPRPLPREVDFWRFRVFGVIVPELNTILERETLFPYSHKYPMLPIHIRPALLASVAIVTQAGPEMLHMLQSHTFGENRNRFIKATDPLVSSAFEWRPPRQTQLI